MADLPLAGWKWTPEAGGSIGLMRGKDVIYLAAKSQFASASPPVALSADEAKLLHEALGKMLAPMKRTKLAA